MRAREPLVSLTPVIWKPPFDASEEEVSTELDFESVCIAAVHISSGIFVNDSVFTTAFKLRFSRGVTTKLVWVVL